LETEQEEKRLLQEQLRQLENSSNEINNKLSKQIDQVEDIFLININQYLLRSS
jgi:polyhydroxyalkanoate synthesis regulator phasin